MKRVMFAVYVVSVLLLSGSMTSNAATLSDLAPAQYQSPVNIDEITIDSAQTTLNIVGTVPNPCHGQPAAYLVQDSQNPQLLIAQLTASVSQENCIALVNDFSTELNLPFLVRTSRVNIDTNQTYVIRFQDFNYEVQIPGSKLL